MKKAITFKKQNPNISELPETQLNIHGAWYGKSGPDMVGRGLAGAWYGGCNMVWNVPTLVEECLEFITCEIVARSVAPRPKKERSAR